MLTFHFAGKGRIKQINLYAEYKLTARAFQRESLHILHWSAKKKRRRKGPRGASVIEPITLPCSYHILPKVWSCFCFAAKSENRAFASAPLPQKRQTFNRVSQKPFLFLCVEANLCWHLKLPVRCKGSQASSSILAHLFLPFFYHLNSFLPCKP